MTSPDRQQRGPGVPEFEELGTDGGTDGLMRRHPGGLHEGGWRLVSLRVAAYSGGALASVAINTRIESQSVTDQPVQVDRRLGQDDAEREAETNTDQDLHQAVRQPKQSDIREPRNHRDIDQHGCGAYPCGRVDHDEGENQGVEEQQEQRDCVGRPALTRICRRPLELGTQRIKSNPSGA
jgi:hypothetical protein